MIFFLVWTAATFWTSGVLVGVLLARTMEANKEPPGDAGQEAVEEADRIVHERRAP